MGAAGSRTPRKNRFATRTSPKPGRIRTQALTAFPSGPVSLDSPRAKWVGSIDLFELRPELYEELMERYFSPAFQAEHRAIMVARGQLAAEGRNAINQGLRDLNGVSDTNWDRMSPAVQEGAITFGVLMCGLLAFGAFRELRRFGVTSSDPPALRAGFARYRLASFTGIVTDYKVWDKSTSTLWERRTEGGHVSRYWTTDTYRHEEFDLVHEGERHHVHTSHATFAGSTMTEFEREPGRMLTAVWATPRFRKAGRYIMFREPGSGPDLRVAVASSSISRIIAPRGWTVLPAMGLGFVIGSSIDAVGSWMQVSSPTFRGFGVAIVAAAIWVGLYVLVSTAREKRFEAREVPRLREVVEAATKQ